MGRASNMAKTSKTTAREPFNTYSHAIGIVLGVAVTVSLSLLSGGSLGLLVVALVFGLSMVVLYTSSTLYHALWVSDAVLLRLRKLDHASIFVFIAGTYTPVVFSTFSGPLKPYALALVWLLALAGVGLKLFTLKMPRWVSTASYVALGWLALLFWPYLKLSPWIVAWLVAGGVAYSLGAIIYGFKWPNIYPKVVGFHGIWHIFVLMGSVCMFLAVLGIYLPVLG
jgi:hemolysin III